MHFYQFPSFLCLPLTHILPPKIKVFDTSLLSLHIPPLPNLAILLLDCHDINKMFQQVCTLYVRNHRNHPNAASSLVSPLQKQLLSKGMSHTVYLNSLSHTYPFFHLIPSILCPMEFDVSLLPYGMRF